MLHASAPVHGRTRVMCTHCAVACLPMLLQASQACSQGADPDAHSAAVHAGELEEARSLPAQISRIRAKHPRLDSLSQWYANGSISPCLSCYTCAWSGSWQAKVYYTRMSWDQPEALQPALQVWQRGSSHSQSRPRQHNAGRHGPAHPLLRPHRR